MTLHRTTGLNLTVRDLLLLLPNRIVPPVFLLRLRVALGLVQHHSINIVGQGTSIDPISPPDFLSIYRTTLACLTNKILAS
ncbi:hypothetical protein Syun_030438 [Stephania yunnanensis]|uniref:Uncharacterized protein n=1 Tax=Stephania yunnanensis TaxID=152371 RepID=A0AAP0EFT1_9MAGN